MTTTTTRYMVALDGSTASEYALRTAVQVMNKKSDELYLLSVTEKLSSHFSSPAFFSSLTDAQASLEKESERLLKRYGKYVQDRGVQHVFALRGTGSHIGELICSTIQTKEIDVLVVGRRGLSGLKRIILGSVSRYCVEHAPCNVLVVKEEVEQQKIEEMEAKEFQVENMDHAEPVMDKESIGKMLEEHGTFPDTDHVLANFETLFKLSREGRASVDDLAWGFLTALDQLSQVDAMKPELAQRLRDWTIANWTTEPYDRCRQLCGILVNVSSPQVVAFLEEQQAKSTDADVKEVLASYLKDISKN